MAGKPGLPILSAMRGRRKGGAFTPQARTLQGIAAHRWALRQFTAWVDSL